MTTTLKKQELKNLIKESIREVIGVESMKLLASSVPMVSVKEQKEIVKLYGKPTPNRSIKSVKVKV